MLTFAVISVLLEGEDGGNISSVLLVAQYA